jgi:hypothetical protein
LSKHTLLCLATSRDAALRAACPTIKLVVHPTSCETPVKSTHACLPPTYPYTRTLAGLKVDPNIALCVVVYWKLASMSLTILLNRTLSNMLGFRGEHVLASETTKVKSWNHITETIQSIIKIRVHTTYSTLSQYMILQHLKLSSRSHKSIQGRLYYWV